MQGKVFHVKDEGTDMVFMAVKFDSEEEANLLIRQGWIVTNRLTFLAIIGPRSAAAMSTFRHPPYDLEQRTMLMGKDHTTMAVAEIVRDLHIEEIPSLLDVTDHELGGET